MSSVDEAVVQAERASMELKLRHEMEADLLTQAYREADHHQHDNITIFRDEDCLNMSRMYAFIEKEESLVLLEGATLPDDLEPETGTFSTSRVYLQARAVIRLHQILEKLLPRAKAALSKDNIPY